MELLEDVMYRPIDINHIDRDTVYKQTLPWIRKLDLEEKLILVPNLWII